MVDRRCAIDPSRRHPLAGTAEPERRLRRAARCRHRRLGRCVSGDRRPREPGASVARTRHVASRHRITRSHDRSPPHHLSRVRAPTRTLARAIVALFRDGPQRRRRSRTRRRGRSVAGEGHRSRRRHRRRGGRPRRPPQHAVVLGCKQSPTTTHRSDHQDVSEGRDHG